MTYSSVPFVSLHTSSSNPFTLCGA